MYTNTDVTTNNQATVLHVSPSCIDLLLTQIFIGKLTIKILGEKIKDCIYLVEDPLKDSPLTQLGENIQVSKDMSIILDKSLAIGCSRLLLLNSIGIIDTIFDLPEEVVSNVLLSLQVANVRNPMSAGRQQATMQGSLGGIRNAVNFLNTNPPGPSVYQDGSICHGSLVVGRCLIINKHTGYRRNSALTLHQEIAALLNTIPEIVIANNGSYFDHSDLVSRLVGLYFASFRAPAGTISLSYPITGYAANWHEHLVGKTINVSINGDRLDYNIQ